MESHNCASYVRKERTILLDVMIPKTKAFGSSSSICKGLPIAACYPIIAIHNHLLTL